MGITFNADEIFEIAEQIERNGAKFYRQAAQKVSVARQVLLDLAAMEDEHERTFAEMRKALTSRQKEPLVFDPDNQAALYLQAMASGHVFNFSQDLSEQLAGKETPLDILLMAIGAEKDSIAYYTGVKECVSVGAGKEKVEGIIREEMGHIATLTGKLRELK
jgi:rubrerythrin